MALCSCTDFRGSSAEAMPEPVKRNEPKAHERAMREFVYLFFGPTIWLLHFTAIYAVQSVFCALASAIHFVPLAIITITALALVILTVPMLRSGERHDGHSSSRFVGRTTRVLALLSAVAVIWGCLAALLLHPCAPLR